MRVSISTLMLNLRHSPFMARWGEGRRSPKELYRNLEEFQLNVELLYSDLTARKILPFIQRGITERTAHDINHSERVIYFTNKIIDVVRGEGCVFSRHEVLLLYIAGWLHDIGYLSGLNEDDHARESCRMIEALSSQNRLPLGDLEPLLRYIVRYHQSSSDLEEVPERYSIDNDVVRLRLVSAIFRLADACHMGEDRANDIVYILISNQFTPTAILHWKANRNILSVDFDIEKRAITISVDNKSEADYLIESLREELNSVLPFIGDVFPCSEIIVSEMPRLDIEENTMSRSATTVKVDDVDDSQTGTN